MIASDGRLSTAHLGQFQRDGYLIVRNLFDAQEMDLLLKIARADRALLSAAHAAVDASGGYSKLWLTADLTKQNIYTAIVHSQRIMSPMEQILEGEVYLYHYKMMLKEPKVGGAWEWHQDYGYWYNNKCLYPYMASCMIAVDRASKANGCLQVLKGSHHLGRIEHGKTGTQTGADPERVELACKHMELAYCEMEPGDAVFFHSNTLHRSDRNSSDASRWSLICCYNAARNPTDDRPGHPSYEKLDKWPDSRVKEVGQLQWDAAQAAAASV